MKLKKNLIWLLTILITNFFLALPTKAQVAIGENKDPESFSILELITSAKKGGLRLPQLTTDERDTYVTPLLISDPDGADEGLVIYNVTENCLEFWNGERWISLCDGLANTCDLTQLDPKSISICYGSNHVFNLDAATGTTSEITYQWEQSTNDATWTNAPGTSTNASYTTPDLTVNTYYRRIATVGTGACGDPISSASALVTVVIGPCIANSFPRVTTEYVDFIVNVDASGNGVASGGTPKTLRFMTYNLGANPSLSPKQQMEYPGCPYDMTVYGGLYQWGRQDHQHTFRCNYTPTSDPTYFHNAQVSLADINNFNGIFIYNTTYDWINTITDTNLWGNGERIETGNGNTGTIGAYDPCPPGWRVPTQQEWALLLNETSPFNKTNAYTGDLFDPTDEVNVYLRRGDTYWVRVVKGYAKGSFAANTMCGYALYKKDVWESAQSSAPQYAAGTAPLYESGAPQPLMFLPAGGSRIWSSGVVSNYGIAASYWSATITPVSYASFMTSIGNNRVNAGNNTYHQNGLPVRCIEH